MVLAQPQNQHVMKAFDLTGKVAAVTGMLESREFQRRTDSHYQEVPVESASRCPERSLKQVPT